MLGAPSRVSCQERRDMFDVEYFPNASQTKIARLCKVTKAPYQALHKLNNVVH